ncbi:MAG: hypothetical protein U0599_27750 [Vicinamibacteria bacterium]
MLDPELRLVVAGARAVVDRADVEIPGPAAEVARRLQRNAVAHLPAEALGEGAPDDDALAVGHEVVPLRGIHRELRVHHPPLLGLDHELGKKFVGSW